LSLLSGPCWPCYAVRPVQNCRRAARSTAAAAGAGSGGSGCSCLGHMQGCRHQQREHWHQPLCLISSCC
jgi:hypothetical protein